MKRKHLLLTLLLAVLVPWAAKAQTQTCEPTWTGTSSEFYIINFKARLSDVSSYQIDNSSTGTPNSTSDYYNTHSITASAGSTIKFLITPSNTSYNYRYALWVDWNDDGDFNDSGEEYWNSSSSSLYENERDFTVRPYAPAGAHRMRVMIDGVQGSYLNSCGENAAGEAEDYKLIVTPASVGDYWSDNFDGSDCGWYRENGTQTNMWYCGSSTHYGNSGKALYIYTTGNYTHAYNNTVSSTVYAYKSLHFEGTKYIFQYNWKSNGESHNDYFRVFLAPVTAQLTAGELNQGLTYNTLPEGWIAVGDYHSGQTEWQSEIALANVPEGDYNVVLMWHNNNANGENPPAAIDNFVIMPKSCPYDVTNLAASNITQNSATITWSDNGSSEWQLYYSTDSDFTDPQIISSISQTQASLTNLQAGTEYFVQVRPDCGNGDYGDWSSILSFVTLQVPVVVDGDNSYSDDFDGDLNWVLVNGALTNHWVQGNDTHLGLNEGKAIYIAKNAAGDYGYNIGDPAVVYAYKTFTLAAGSYTYSFDWRAKGEYYANSDPTDYLRAVLVPASTELTASEFLPVGLSHNTLPEGWIALDGESQLNNSNSWAAETDDVTVPTDGDYKVVFIWRNDDTSGNDFPAAIDNFSMSVAACQAPLGLTYFDLTDSSVRIDWVSNVYSWEIAVDQEGDDLGYQIIASNVSDKPYLLEDLNPLTTYHVKVRTKCDENVYSSWSNIVTFTTKQTAATLPYTDDFEGDDFGWILLNGNATNTWAWGTATHNGDESEKALYVSNDNGTTNAYTNNPNTAKSMVYATKLFNFGRNVYNISYDWKCKGESSFDYMRIFLVPEYVELEANNTGTPPYDEFYNNQNTPESWINLDEGHALCESEEWQTASFEVAVPEGQYKMVFAWINDGSLGANPPAAVDNISIQVVGKVFERDGDWDVSHNWLGSLTPTSTDEDVILRANATIPSSCVALANNITIADGKTLTIADGGQLKHNNTGVQATVMKHITGYGAENTQDNKGYVLLALPVYPANFNIDNSNITTGDFDFYRWDNAEEAEWRNYHDASFEMAGFKGYLYANQEDVDLTFEGLLRPSANSAPAHPSYSNNPDFGNWDLLGNPFVCNAYITDGYGSALAFYKMNTDGDGLEAVDAGTPIAPMEGVFCYAESTVHFTRTAPAVLSYSNLNMSLLGNNQQLDNAIIRFGEGNTLEKFSFRANSSKIYFSQENKDYAVINAEGQVGEIPVNFKAEHNGSYTLSFTNEEVTFSYLHLIDNLTGNDVDLLQNPSYSFNAKTTDYESRFRLVFATGSSASSETDSFAFVNGMGNLCIFGIEGQATVQVIDMLGHVLSSETFSGSYEKRINAAPGMYVLRLINGTDVKAQKIVVK